MTIEITYVNNKAKFDDIIAMGRLRNIMLHNPDMNKDKKLVEEVYKTELKWLNENMYGRYRNYGNTFSFDTEEDAMAFKLKFM